MRLWNCFILISVIFSCRSSKQVPAEVHPSDHPVATSSVEKIVFVNFKIRADSIHHQNSIEVINTVFSEGHLKNNSAGNIRSANKLTCFLYENNAPVDSVTLEHPLYRVYEYMNERSEMVLKETRETAAEFFVRFQIREKTDKIKVMETVNNTTKELIFFTLKKQ